MTKVQILSTPGCAGCEQVKRMLERIKKDMPGLKVEEVDLTKHPEVAAKYQLMAAPGIIINGKLEFTGVPKEKELREKLSKS